MTVYIALLRGINVGGHKRIRMDDLKRVFEQSGLRRVQTYIQSGNVLFESDEAEEPLRLGIEREIEAAFGFPVDTALRTAEELASILARSPFKEAAASEPDHLHLGLSSRELSPETADRLAPYRSGEEDFRVEGREIYLWLPHGVHSSKLASRMQKLDTPVTVRNWNTAKRLAELAAAMSNG
jgi:uncharacterized protein (DUF1697 family)